MPETDYDSHGMHRPRLHHGQRLGNEDGTVCGIKLPAGLRSASEPVFTPSTKAELGDHDENVSLEEGAAFIDKTFPGKARNTLKKSATNTLAL